ncbi:hypothetical protein NY_014-163 [NY_014 poxvirus]|uniref:hypothetical protein n=1 Tax=NY_014 poxvirus TaxID=2025360 RepID=UPI000B9A0B2A|nr:hypothetical protein CKM51_gp163 [NY_014 poxvirus]AST09564.1 hypothetical protein NY_014-163 [NY_014 poxvirus]
MANSKHVIIIDTKTFVSKSNEFDYIKRRSTIEPSKKNVCRDIEHINFCDNTCNNNIIADIPYFDKAVSDKWYSLHNTKLYRVSRFATLIKAKDNNNNYIVYRFELRNNIVSVIISLDDESTCKIISQSAEQNMSTILKPSNMIILSMGSSFVIQGKGNLLIVMYDDCINEAPLLKSFSSDDVIISRHRRLHDEMPSDWFKFYVCLTSDCCSKLYIVVNGSVMFAKADDKTHAIISHDYIDNDKINDECDCCYSVSSIKILNRNELLSKSSCEINRHCVTMNLTNIGTFYSSITGKYNEEMTKIALSAASYMINNRDHIPGRGNGYYIYGIASK